MEMDEKWERILNDTLWKELKHELKYECYCKRREGFTKESNIPTSHRRIHVTHIITWQLKN